MPAKTPSSVKNLVALFALVHVLLNDKGGEGKSTFAQTLVEYLAILLKKRVTVVEGDRSQPDIKRLYAPLIGHPEYPTLIEVNHAFFSEDQRLRAMSDGIFESALKNGGEIIWNTPANVSAGLFPAFREDGLMEFAAENQIGIVNWCITSGNPDAIQHFQRCLKEFPKMRHVLVKNYGLNDDFSHLDHDQQLQDAVKAYRVPVIDFPKIPYEEHKLLKANNLTFSQGIRVLRETKGMLAAHRLSRFFNQACQQIEASGVFHDS